MKEEKLPFALIAIDLCLLKIINNELCVFLTDVNKDSLYQGLKCLPGGLVRLDESAEDTLKRIIVQKGLLKMDKIYTEQLYTFSDIKRDKRGRVVSCAFLGLYSGLSEEGFIPIGKIKKLAYDHSLILKTGLERLKTKIEYTTIIKKLFSNNFTFSELQKVYEIILGKEIDKRNFRKKIDSLNILEETKDKRKEGRMRPASLYKFKTKNIETLNILG
ncbi:MAG: NUDIX hydrolase [Candidatus Nomurabacteria bacterium]